jgi:hypothetical protein
VSADRFYESSPFFSPRNGVNRRQGIATGRTNRSEIANDDGTDQHDAANWLSVCAKWRCSKSRGRHSLSGAVECDDPFAPEPTMNLVLLNLIRARPTLSASQVALVPGFGPAESIA